MYTAIIREGQILMVRHIHDGFDYWTLPGGAVEPGELLVQAARRELLEETGIQAFDFRDLFTDGLETCFAASCDAAAAAVVGSDPELPGSAQVINDVRWFPVDEKRDDVQVAKVLANLDERS